MGGHIVTKSKITRAAVLTRVSTDEQAGEGSTSLEDQARLGVEFIESKGWEFTGEVYQDVMSGTLPVRSRPELRRAIQDAARGEFDVLVVLNLSRLSRKLRVSAEVADDLAEVGVGIASVQESMIDTSTPSGRFVFAQFCAIAELDRESILIKTVAGQRALARQNRLPGGEPPYGYRRVGSKRDSRVVVDEAEREVLRLGYDLLVKRRKNAYQVAEHFNDAGIKPRKADRWSAEVVRHMWRNPAHSTGKVIWGLPKTSGAGGQRRHKAKVDRQGNPVYGAPVEIDLGNPVFTAAEHRALIRALERRSTGTVANPAVSRLLTGRVFTHEGHAMYGVNLPREAWQGAYRCATRRQSAGANRCSCPQLRALPIEELVWAEVVRILSDPARLEAAARAYLALPEEGGDAEADRRALDGVRAEIERFERGLAKAERGVLLADSDEDERRQAALVADLKRELSAARERLVGYEALVSSEEARNQALSDVAALADRARGRLHTLADAERAEVVRILQVSVVCSGPVVAGMPESVAISGVIDPRMWGTDSGTSGSSASPTPADSPSGAQSAPGVAPWPRWPSPGCWS
ncbi:recombinase family protein [Microbacterium sp. H1-D42]|uniref:recombinase family protein n=1 Tax=Microbacterium sp. H1-D42 TaxID=2925844 RepID=UPI001F53A38F|nr:recombinase family protein [Microbacterium sp. H1-D42]UNK71740.1 recombinase family protein [Microbacterium sp. H1-D42]